MIISKTQQNNINNFFASLNLYQQDMVAEVYSKVYNSKRIFSEDKDFKNLNNQLNNTEKVHFFELLLCAIGLAKIEEVKIQNT